MNALALLSRCDLLHTCLEFIWISETTELPPPALKHIRDIIVPRDIMIICIQKRARTVSPRQQPNDKQLSLSLSRAFFSLNEWMNS